MLSSVLVAHVFAIVCQSDIVHSFVLCMFVCQHPLICTVSHITPLCVCSGIYLNCTYFLCTEECSCFLVFLLETVNSLTRTSLLFSLTQWFEVLLSLCLNCSLLCCDALYDPSLVPHQRLPNFSRPTFVGMGCS